MSAPVELLPRYRDWLVVGEPHAIRPGTGPKTRVVVRCSCVCGRTTRLVPVSELTGGKATRCILCTRENFRRAIGQRFRTGSGSP